MSGRRSKLDNPISLSLFYSRHVPGHLYGHIEAPGDASLFLNRFAEEWINDEIFDESMAFDVYHWPVGDLLTPPSPAKWMDYFGQMITAQVPLLYGDTAYRYACCYDLLQGDNYTGSAILTSASISPEPATWWLIALSTLCLGVFRRSVQPRKISRM